MYEYVLHLVGTFNVLDALGYRKSYPGVLLLLSPHALTYPKAYLIEYTALASTRYEAGELRM